MVSLLIDHDHPVCIGCGACAAIVPRFWEMVGDKAHLIDSEEIEEHEHLQIASMEDFTENQEAAEACPVNCIHLVKEGEKII